LPVADGGSVALSTGSGIRQPLVRDSSGAVLPVKLLWLVKAPAGTMLILTARTQTGVSVAWVDGGGERSDPLIVSTAAQTEPDASQEWSTVPSLLAVPGSGCYEVTTQVDGRNQTLRILVA
jgi:hypothetical protein